jgi:transmembrane sensor
MTPDASFPAANDATADLAADWVLRQDRGLTPVEQDELSQWLAVDPCHRAAFAEHSRGWDELDRLSGLQSSLSAIPDPDLLAPREPAAAPVAGRFYLLALAAAAVVVFGCLFLSRPTPPAPTQPLEAAIEQRALPDGSVVQLNHRAVLVEEFTPGERRVRLLQGEASFTVAKNPARPFVVVAHGIEVKAVGTVFNVRLGGAEVEVLVTEGKVRVDQPDEHAATGMSAAVPLLVAGEHAVVPLTHSGLGSARVNVLSPDELAGKLAWQPRLLDFVDRPLADIAAEFNRHNPVQLQLDDPALGALHLSVSFRSDNLEGFVRLMESDFGMKADRRDETTILLGRGNPAAR